VHSLVELRFFYFKVSSRVPEGALASTDVDDRVPRQLRAAGERAFRAMGHSVELDNEF
jgi:hypothetical protein